jgi:hypothetical protein
MSPCRDEEVGAGWSGDWSSLRELEWWSQTFELGVSDMPYLLSRVDDRKVGGWGQGDTYISVDPSTC